MEKGIDWGSWALVCNPHLCWLLMIETQQWHLDGDYSSAGVRGTQNRRAHVLMLHREHQAMWFVISCALSRYHPSTGLFTTRI